LFSQHLARVVTHRTIRTITPIVELRHSVASLNPFNQLNGA